MIICLLFIDEEPGVQRIKMIGLTRGSKAGGGARFHPSLSDTKWAFLPTTQHGLGAGRWGEEGVANPCSPPSLLGPPVWIHLLLATRRNIEEKLSLL